MQNDLTIRRTNRRRTLALVMLPDGQFEVRAPAWVGQKKIDAFVVEHASWMEKQRARRHFWPEPVKRTWQEGDIFYLHGAPLTLRLDQGARAKVMMDEGQLWVTAPIAAQPEVVSRQIIRWYRRQAVMHFGARVAELADIMGEAMPRLAFSNAHTRWGSCRAATRDVRLSLRLLMAPKPVQDYVIVHELAHLTHMDHSTRFWSLVAEYVPNWQEYAESLKQNDGIWRLS